jgi:hypothetical protein
MSPSYLFGNSLNSEGETYESINEIAHLVFH